MSHSSEISPIHRDSAISVSAVINSERVTKERLSFTANGVSEDLVVISDYGCFYGNFGYRVLTDYCGVTGGVSVIVNGNLNGLVIL